MARVVVVGAGIGGLTAAVALRRHGFEVEVYERTAELGEVGAGLQLGPNAVRVLRALGLEPALRRAACELDGLASLDGREATMRHREPLGSAFAARFGAPYLTAHRADVHRLLVGALPDASIHLGACCVGASSMGDAAVARFADGREVEADAVVGADGIRSAVREGLSGADRPRFSGQMGWRAILPIACVPAAVGPGRSVRVRLGDLTGWIAPTGHVICYPIRGGELYNVFAGHVTDSWVEESWTLASSRAELLSAYEGWNESLLDMLGHVDRCFKWGIYDRDPLRTWTRGRVTLLGDAAHPMMPTLAQGAAMAMEDAYALARNLARRRGEPARGLAAYDGERAPRAARVLLQARAQFANNKRSPAPPPLDRAWIFAHDATRGPGAQSSAMT